MFKDTLKVLESLPENRYNHILRVVDNIKNILNKLSISNDFKSIKENRIYEKLIETAYLHDIGYADSLNKENFHAYDGYVYLKRRGYCDLICKLVLHHTYSGLLNVMGNYIDNSIYINNSLDRFTKEEMCYLEILTLADMMSDGKGNFVTIDNRIKDIGDRHGYSSIVYQHIIEVKKLLMNSEIVREYLEIN